MFEISEDSNCADAFNVEDDEGDYEGTVDDIDNDGVHQKHLDVNGGEADQVNVFWV